MSRLIWCVAPVLLLAACGKERPPESVKAEVTKNAPEEPQEVVLDASAQKQSGVVVSVARMLRIPRLVRATGRVTNDDNRTWRVGAVTEGRIEKILANPGDFVKTGQVLARMHSHDIHESRALFLKARTDLNRAKTAQEFARRTRDRTRKLLDLKASSQEQMEHAEAALRYAQSEVSNAEVELERTRRHLTEFLQIPAEEPADHSDGSHDDEDLIPISAPADGTVIVRNISRGAVVSPAADLFLISDLSHVWIIAEVHADQLSSLRVGMPARVSVSAFPGRTFSGRIGKIGDTLNPETRTLQVRIEVPNTPKVLKPEMYASTEIEAGELDPALYLPSESLQEVRGSSMVFVEKAPGRFEARMVSVGRSVDGEVEITRGLREGERVVTAGSFILKSEFLKASMAEEE